MRPGPDSRAPASWRHARYEIAEDMALHAKVVWRRLVGGAAHSPIVDVAGDRDQWQLAIGLSRVFGFGL